METDIIIRTYRGDAKWLPFCYRGIEKFAKDFRQVLVLCPEPDVELIEEVTKPFGHRVAGSEWWEDDYLGQQWVKMNADLFTDADFICHVDSDAVFKREIHPDGDLYDEDGRVYMITEPYATLEMMRWPEIVYNVLKWRPTLEYMRRLPLTYPRSVYKPCREYIEKVNKKPAREVIKNRPFRDFTEFNVLGAFCDKFHHDLFNWCSPNAAPPDLVLQNWSWGGLKDDVKERIEEILK